MEDASALSITDLNFKLNSFNAALKLTGLFVMRLLSNSTSLSSFDSSGIYWISQKCSSDANDPGVLN